MKEKLKLKCLNTSCNKETNNPKYCSRSCAASANNKKREKGVLRSKLELFIEPRLCEYYPKLKIEFNKKTIGSELDIYIPELFLGFEINGAFHYDIIFGEKVLEYTQKNDEEKRRLCKEAKIKLVEIDARSVGGYVTKKSGWRYLRMIIEEVDACLKEKEKN